MKSQILKSQIFLLFASVLILAPIVHAQAVKVLISPNATGGATLTRDGKPFQIRGGGGGGSRELLASFGGNSFRTWGIDNLDQQLAEARKNNLLVTVGIWLGQERTGFSYNNADQVAEQLEKVRAAVTKYKDDPNVLMWALGNEMEGYAKGDNAAIWSAVESAAALVHKLDPNHPTMTVVAEIGGDRVKNINRLCPEIDIVGINCYGGILSLADRYKKVGGTKPFVVTEFGPAGVWEIKKEANGAPPELTSTQKAYVYRDAWTKTTADPLCLGMYAFAWGDKREATATWFGLLLPDGSHLGGVDALQELWTGKPPANKCPTIDEIKIDSPETPGRKPGMALHVKLTTTDPENDPLKVDWVLERVAEEYGTGGDAEAAPQTFPDSITNASPTGTDITAPQEGGIYRLYAYVHDDHKGAATANVTFAVDGPKPVIKSKTAELPLTLFADGVDYTYVPSGWMGNNTALAMDDKCTDNPHTGATCMKLDYKANDNFAGIVWQSPANDWGDAPGGRDLTGAKKLTFWARGKDGGEKVEFKLGVLGKEKKFPDSDNAATTATLTTDWKQYEIDLTGKDLTHIKTGFVWVVAGQGKPTEFFLDDIKYE